MYSQGTCVSYKGVMAKKRNVINNAKETVAKAAEKVTTKVTYLVDENGNGKIDLEDFVVKALRIPGVHVDRTEFLRRVLTRYCDEKTVEKAVLTTPAKAGISREIIDPIVDESIALQKTLATATSVGLGATPGGIVVDTTTTVADMGQFYGQLLIVMQKVMYLYGYPELDLRKSEAGIDDGTMNLIIIGIGTMAGVEAAGKFMNKMAVMLANNVPRILLQGVLAKKVAFQVAKEVLKYFGIRLTRDLATKYLGNAIKFAGGAIVGGITMVTFNSSCNNFKKAICNTPLSDPNYIDQSNVIQAQFTTIDEVEDEFEKDIDLSDSDPDDEDKPD